MPADPAILDDLIARLEAATGPDRRLDDNLHDALERPAWYAESYTGSPAAALDLVSLVLPDHDVKLFIDRSGRLTTCALTSTEDRRLGSDRLPLMGQHASTARAILIALCRALRTQETTHAD